MTLLPITFSARSFEHENNPRPATRLRSPRRRFTETTLSETRPSRLGIGFNRDAHLATPPHPDQQIDVAHMKIPLAPPQRKTPTPYGPNRLWIENGPDDNMKPYEPNLPKHGNPYPPTTLTEMAPKAPNPLGRHAKPFQTPPPNRVIIAETGEIIELPPPPHSISPP